ncbi:MAG: type I 3-dehydroquinate dehydratase [Hyphomicrobiaceae bacterium]|nr:type I 3-dehydroquinate dehydratase [Hyphomicrobiaceae bacterium]
MNHYKTCVPVEARTIKVMSRDLSRALKVSDYAELRLDYLDPADIPDALKAARKHMRKIVCTIRPKSEGGGEFSGGESSREDLLVAAAEYRPFLLDVEHRSLSKSPRLRRRLSNADLLVSWHNGVTPGTGVLEKKVKEMARFGGRIKMACKAKSKIDALRMIGLYAKCGDNRLISFGIGNRASFSRITCMDLGSPYTYACIDRPFAPGQMRVSTIRQMDKLRFQ